MDAVAREVIEHVVEGAPIEERQQRLGHGLGERAQPCPLSSDEHDGLHARVTFPRIDSSSARRRSAAHANGKVSCRQPCARCLR